MSRSRKAPVYTISKAWDRFKERAFRRYLKRELRKVEQEIKFDPDADFEAAHDHGKMGSWGTRIGWDVPPDPDDTYYEEYLKAQRK